MKKINKRLVLAVWCIAAGILAQVHNYMLVGRFIDLPQILHHEFFAGLAVAFGFGILLSTR